MHTDESALDGLELVDEARGLVVGHAIGRTQCRAHAAHGGRSDAGADAQLVEHEKRLGWLDR
jgi:hypothetical protein